MSIIHETTVTHTYKTTRWEIIGTWSGPANPAGDYTRECHKEYTRDRSRAEWCDSNNIRFDDGTMLYLSVRPMGHGERRHKGRTGGYTSLIDDCVRFDVASVADLPDVRKNREARG